MTRRGVSRTTPYVNRSDMSAILKRDDFLRMSSRLSSLFEHDLFRKPVSTPDHVRGRLFRDHAQKTTRRSPRGERRAARRYVQRILAALSSVFQTPQASGMPTNSQNSAACQSSPPLPMPNEPCAVIASRLAVAACSLATSSALMCHLGSTGLTR